MPDVEDRILARIERRLGIAGIVDLLAHRLPASDLQALLLAVTRRRVAQIRPAELLERYERDRFVRPSKLAPGAVRELERRAESTLPPGFEALALAPVAPLGAVAALTSVHQNSVLATTRGSEVVSDPTNVLALECAVRRRALLAAKRGNNDRVRLAASHRTLRAQVWDDPRFSQHFALLGLCTAGRDEGAFRFERETLLEHGRFYLALLTSLGDLGLPADGVAASFTPIETRWEGDLQRAVIAPLAAEFPAVRVELDSARTRALDYYTGACLEISARGPAGDELQLVDGGFTDWTQQLLGNRKERLMITGIGLERLAETLQPSA
jgi:hypothetical protein